LQLPGGAVLLLFFLVPLLAGMFGNLVQQRLSNCLRSFLQAWPDFNLSLGDIEVRAHVSKKKKGKEICINLSLEARNKTKYTGGIFPTKKGSSDKPPRKHRHA
jgi:hypothetical protein